MKSHNQNFRIELKHPCVTSGMNQTQSASTIAHVEKRIIPLWERGSHRIGHLVYNVEHTVCYAEVN